MSDSFHFPIVKVSEKSGQHHNGPRLGRSLARSPAREHAGAREKPRLTLRDDGISYGDYPRLRGDRLPQLTDLLFLKMADERSRPPLSGQMSQPSPIPAAYAWPSLLARDDDALFDHYRHTLEELGKQPGTLALIFGKAQNKFDSPRLMAMLTLRAPSGRPISGGDCQDPAKLRRVIVDLIDAENWSAIEFAYAGCQGVRSPSIARAVAAAWMACKPLLGGPAWSRSMFPIRLHL